MEIITFKMGFIDNAILCLSFYFTWLCIEKLFLMVFKSRLNKIFCGVLSAGIANTISDYLGFALQGEFILANAVALGCIVGMIVIPICESLKLKFNLFNTDDCK